MNKSPAYLIRATRHYYAGTINNGRVSYYGRHLGQYGMDPDAPIVAFASRADARAAIKEIEAATYYLSHNAGFSRLPVHLGKAGTLAGRKLAGPQAETPANIKRNPTQ